MALAWRSASTECGRPSRSPSARCCWSPRCRLWRRAGCRSSTRQLRNEHDLALGAGGHHLAVGIGGGGERELAADQGLQGAVAQAGVEAGVDFALFLGGGG